MRCNVASDIDLSLSAIKPPDAEIVTKYIDTFGVDMDYMLTPKQSQPK